MSRFFRAALTLALVFMFGAAMFAGGFLAGHFTALPESPLTRLIPPPARGGTPAGLEATFAPFWEAWDLVHREYVDQPVDDIKLMQGAISGMLDSLGDQHTGYISPAEYKLDQTIQTGELEGIGATVEKSGDYAKIVSPIPGSPADAAGLRPEDLIVKVDRVDVAGKSLTEIVSLVRGPAGTRVHLTIRRQGHVDPLEFDLVRAKITIPSVESKMLEGDVAYVKINSFGDKTTGELKDALKSLMRRKPAAMVLDLRGNPGGLLDTAIEVASQFIPDGVVMRERFGDGREMTYQALSGGLATEVRLVVLIDKGSASASEIVAGAIQDRKRGTVVGETSYGKGSVQDWHRLQGENGAVRVTIARWLTPNGRSIHQQGIAPDIAVELTEADHAARRDPQLDRAIGVILGK